VLAYTPHEGAQDAEYRIAAESVALTAKGFKATALRASMNTSGRRTGILDQMERGIDTTCLQPGAGEDRAGSARLPDRCFHADGLPSPDTREPIFTGTTDSVR
jgi:hypothetical protein